VARGIDELQLLRSIYRRLDREGVLADHPSLSLGDLDDFFQRLAAQVPSGKASRTAPRRRHRSVILYTDGGSRGNPGPAGYGVVLLSKSGKAIAKLSEFIGRATSNEAEYRGLIGGLEAARDCGAVEVSIRADSQLLIRQINGTYKVKSRRLLPLFQRARSLLETFETWRAEHIPREQNLRADSLANEAMDRAGA